MKAVILAGGFGTRIAEESDHKPKPMVDVGGRPLLWHIMKTYSHHGIRDFIICLGYKGYQIKEYFYNYYRHTADLEINLRNGEHRVLNSQAEDWNILLIDTGQHTMTGGRLKRIASHVQDETFCMTYGDGLADIDIGAQLALHRAQGRLATVTAVQPPGRFGVLELDEGDCVTSFAEKPRNSLGWINGGFFVLEPAALDTIDGDDTSWEEEPLRRLTANGQLTAYRHRGFWQPCDTLRDKRLLDEHWRRGDAPWALWERE